MSDAPLLAFYADDFTGATDALEGLARNGLKAGLFTEPPTTDVLNQYEDLDAIGVASTSRSMAPNEMEAMLPDHFTTLDTLNTPIVHYKVCSTFDSAPDIGNIGKAIELAQEVFSSNYVPLSQPTTAPSDRYVTFGNLFAEADGEVYRIDRHPTMSTHPTTPMTEGDIRRHLAEQTNLSIGSVFLPNLTGDARSALESAKEHAEIVVFDGVTRSHLERIGRLLWEDAMRESGTLFTVGSSGLEHDALPAYWKKTGVIEDTSSRLNLQPPVDAIAVMSGSVSPETATQINRAVDNGYKEVRIDTPRLVDPGTAKQARADAVDEATAAVKAGSSVILYTAKGPDDPAISSTKKRYESVGPSEPFVPLLGRQQGAILRSVIEQTNISRFCVAGGDTSSHVVSSLPVEMLMPIGPISPGSPLCQIVSADETFDALEVVLKGGKSSDPEYFEIVRQGGVHEY